MDERKRKIIYIISVTVFALAWEILARIINQPLILPGLMQVSERTVKLFAKKNFRLSLLASFERVVIAFLISAFIGTVSGFISGIKKEFRTFISFPLSLIRSTPVVALIMIVLFWFPSDVIPVFCALLMNLPIIIDGVSKSVENTDKKLLHMAQVFDVPVITKITCIYIPSAVPYIKGNLRTIFSQSWKIVAAGEILSLPRNGLGTLLQDSRIIMESETVFALVLVLTVSGILTEKILFHGTRILVFACSLIIKKRISSYKKINSETENRIRKSVPEKIIIHNLNFSYNEKIIYKNFSLQISSEKITAITAPTGRGKTTLFNILCGIIPKEKYSGKIKCPGTSYIFQDPRLVENMSAIKNIAFPMFNSTSRKQAYAIAFRYLNKANLSDLAFTEIRNLSGGQKQKVQVLRALAFRSDIILMDEGTSSLDQKSKSELWKLILEETKAENRGLIFITHDSSEAQKYADTVVSI